MTGGLFKVLLSPPNIELVEKLKAQWPQELSSAFASAEFRLAFHYLPYSDISLQRRIEQVDGPFLLNRSWQLLKEAISELIFHRQGLGFRVSQGQAALVRQPIHEISLKNWLKEQGSELEQIRISFGERLSCCLKSLKWSWVKWASLKPLVLNLWSQKAGERPAFLNLFFVAALFRSRLNSELISSAFLKLNRRRGALNQLIGFEHGEVGEGVCLAGKKLGLKSLFIEHGLQHTNNFPSPYDEFFLIYECSESYFKYFYPKASVLIEKSQSDLFKAQNKKIAVCLLEYPNLEMSAEKMRELWEAVMGRLAAKGWQLILRPHPRDHSSWFESLFELEGVTRDPYESVEYLKSLERNAPLMILSLTSASLFEPAVKNCCLRVFIANPWTQCVYAPFLSELISIDPNKALSPVFSLSGSEILEELSIRRKIPFVKNLENSNLG